MQLKPLRSEKTMRDATSGRYAFVVDQFARKPEIRKEVEKIFGVNVIKIQTMIMAGKSYRTGKKAIKATRTDWKKAILTVKSGQKIDLFEVTS